MAKDISDLLGGAYLSAENVPDPIIVTIEGNERVELEGRERLVVYFEELPKGMLCNKVNLVKFVTIFKARDPDDWSGKKVQLQADDVMFQGRETKGLRVYPYAPPKPAVVVPKAVDPSPDIPF